MSTRDVPTILAIDDDPEELDSSMRAALGEKARMIVLHPRDVEVNHLRDADLVLVDFLLDNWPERNEAPLAMRPVSGLAVATLLREHADIATRKCATAFALHSAHLDTVRGRLPPSTREHLIARLNNLEWAFAKSNKARWNQILMLAGSVLQLPRSWPMTDEKASETEALRLLDLRDEYAWFERARRNVLDCQPPIHDLRGGGHGSLFLRWLLHQVMPYPCFLWQEEWVAARLRMSVPSLRMVMDGGGQLADDLSSMKYSGLLAGFLGVRWWRAALEEYVWNLTDGRSIDVTALTNALKQRTTVSFDPLGAEVSIVSLDSTLAADGNILSPDKAVRVRPDQWPPFADTAWTSIQLAKDNSFLRAIVDPLDSDRLEEDEAGDR